MAQRAGFADLPLHGGRVPAWLASRMARLGRLISEAIVFHYGADELLAPERVRARGLFDPYAVETLKREHLSGARTHADRLWTLMMLELWTREYLDARGRWTLR